MTEDESGDSEDDELSCVTGGEREGDLTGLAKFRGELISKVRCP